MGFEIYETSRQSLNIQVEFEIVSSLKRGGAA